MGLIATVEDAMIEIARETLEDRVRVVGSLPGAWTYDLLLKLLQSAPAIYVSFLGGQARPGALDAALDARFNAYTISKNAAGEKARRRGDATEIGAYEMLELIVPKLHKHTVPDIGTLKFQSIDNLFTEATFELGGAVYCATFSLALTLPLGLALDAFVTFHQDIDMEPADGEIDGADTVNLPQ